MSARLAAADPCPKLAADIAADMARRVLEILGRDPLAELAEVEDLLIKRYRFTRRQVQASAARALAVARRIRIDRMVAAT